MTLKELCKKLTIAIQVNGEVNSPYPRMYFWHCRLGDELGLVTTHPNDSEMPAQGSGIDPEEALRDLAERIRGKTIYIIRKGKPPEEFVVPTDLTA